MTTQNIIILTLLIILYLIIATFISFLTTKNDSIKALKEKFIQDCTEYVVDCIIYGKFKDIDKIVDYNNSLEIPYDDLYLACLAYMKDTILTERIYPILDNLIENKFVRKSLYKFIEKNPTLIDDAIEKAFEAVTMDDRTVYDVLIAKLNEYVEAKNKSIDKIEQEAAIIADAYENEKVGDAVEYNGEHDKSEYDIARENFEEKVIEYPEEENLDDIPEELIEIIAASEKEEIIE